MRRREIPSLSCHLHVLQQAGRLCAMILERYEWQALCCVVNNTSIPPDSPPTLEEAARLIGRLGGHLGRKHDGMPGAKTISRGLRRLEDISQAWLIMSQMLNRPIDVGNA